VKKFAKPGNKSHSRETGAARPLDNGVIPPTKEVRRYPLGDNADFIRQSTRALPQREQRNYAD